MGLKFQNFLLFPRILQKGTLRGTNFGILVFLRPYLRLVEVTKGTLTSGASPYPFFARVDPRADSISLNSTQSFYPFRKFARISGLHYKIILSVFSSSLIFVLFFFLLLRFEEVLIFAAFQAWLLSIIIYLIF